MIEAPDESLKFGDDEEGGKLDRQTFSDFGVPKRLFGTTFKRKKSVDMVFASKIEESQKEVRLNESFKERLL